MTPTSSMLMDALNDVEARYPVLDWQIGGTRLWPVLRLRWFFAIWGREYAATPTTGAIERAMALVCRASEPVRGAIACQAARLRDHRGEDRKDGARDVLLLSDGVSLVSFHGKRYDRLCDPAVEAFQSHGLKTMTLTPTHEYRIPRHSPSVFIQPEMDRADVWGLLSARRLRSGARLEAHEQVVKRLADIGMSHPVLSEDKICTDMSRLLSMAQKFDVWIQRTAPSLAVVVSYYSLQGMGFVLACRRRRIPVVDLQHGAQGALHPAYGRFPVPPPGGYETLPDWFWVWSPVEAEAVAAWAGNGTDHRAFVGGNPWLDMWMSGNHPEIARQIELARSRKGAGDRKVVLVTLQWGISGIQQLRWLWTLMQNASDDLVWWIRMHPLSSSEDRAGAARVLKFGDSATLTHDVTDAPLYALLPQVDVHLTHSSSTVIEAAAFGVPSVITSNYGAELYPEQIRGGMAIVVTGDVREVLRGLLAQAARRQAPDRPPAQTDKFGEFLAMLHLAG